MNSLFNFMVVFFGSGLGGVMRYGVGRLLPWQEGRMPLATLCVNLLGCFLIGFFSSMSMRFPGMGKHLSLLLTVGVCGGFTTFSTFSNETLIMLRGGQTLLALAYIGANVVTGLLLVYLGICASRLL